MRKVREVPTQFPREEDQMSDYGFSAAVSKEAPKPITITFA